jgi:hypothetical protein
MMGSKGIRKKRAMDIFVFRKPKVKGHPIFSLYGSKRAVTNNKIFAYCITSFTAVLCAIFWLSCRPAPVPIDRSKWDQHDVSEVVWKSEDISIRGARRRYTVSYQYKVNGETYYGNAIAPGVNSVVASAGSFPVDILVRLKDVEGVWVKRDNPAQAALLLVGEANVKEELRRLHLDLTIKYKIKLKYE